MTTSALPSDLSVESLTMALRLMEVRIAELESNLEQRVREKTSWEQDKKLLHLVADNVDDLIAVVDCHGRRIWNNRAYFKVLGYAPEELQGSYSFLEIHPDDQMKVAAAFADSMQQGFSGRIDYRMQHKDGSWIMLESSSRAVYDEQKRVEYIILIARDISLRSRVEEEKAKSSQIETLSVVTKGIAAEFNDIITAMHRHITAARQVAPAGTPVAGRLTEAERTALRANEIMQRLSYLIDKEEGPRHPISAKRFLQEIADKVSRTSNTPARCELLLPGDLRPFIGEEDAVCLVFTEILTNAVQATKTHGVIRISGENLVITPDQGGTVGVPPATTRSSTLWTKAKASPRPTAPTSSIPTSPPSPTPSAWVSPPPSPSPSVMAATSG